MTWSCGSGFRKMRTNCSNNNFINLWPLWLKQKMSQDSDTQSRQSEWSDVAACWFFSAIAFVHPCHDKRWRVRTFAQKWLRKPGRHLCHTYAPTPCKWRVRRHSRSQPIRFHRRSAPTPSPKLARVSAGCLPSFGLPHMDARTRHRCGSKRESWS